MRLSRSRIKAYIALRARGGWLPPVLLVIDACYVIALAYLCVLALKPPPPGERVPGLWGFGTPGSHWTIAVVLAFPVAHFALRRLVRKAPFSAQPLIVIAAMAASALVLGMSAYWRCYGDQAPFFAPLAWTLALFLGNVENVFGEPGNACVTVPVAFEVARLLALATTLTAALAAGLELFRSQLDRFAIWRARPVTAVVGVDDDTVSMVRAILRTQNNPAGVVAVLTDNVESDAAKRVQALGARLRAVNLADPESMAPLTLWKRLDRLYLLSPDPVENLKRFNVIDAAVTKSERHQARMPLTVRIDDPWQAEVWRRSFLVSTDRCWVADAVGHYETTAAKLVRHMTTRPKAAPTMLDAPTTVVLCGLFPLTYAMASELAQLQREQQLYRKPNVIRPSNVIIFAKGAKSFVDDHEIRQGRMAPDGTMLPVVHYNEEPTVDAIAEFLADKDPASYTFVLGDPSLETQGTRLASRFPDLRVYLASSSSTSLVDISIVGHLYSFPIDMELDADAPQDVWERAAELVHELFSAGKPRNTRTTKPWKELDSFVRQSNRRQLLNALWMVETLGGHTWNSLEQAGPTESLPADFTGLEPMKQLEILGFDREAVERMIEAEHEDWRRYHLDADWKYADKRDDERKRHNRLLPWGELIARNPDYVKDSCRSLVSTLINLRNLGYRSVPKERIQVAQATPVGSAGDERWQHFRRHGEITAEKRDHAWTWTAPSGESMQAQPGDWAVVDDKGRERSVAAEVFEATHEQIGPRRYRRSGTVLARQVTERTVVQTLEGEAVAEARDWIVRGEQGEMWPVPDEQFRASYDGPLGAEVAG